MLPLSRCHLIASRPPGRTDNPRVVSSLLSGFLFPSRIVRQPRLVAGACLSPWHGDRFHTAPPALDLVFHFLWGKGTAKQPTLRLPAPDRAGLLGAGERRPRRVGGRAGGSRAGSLPSGERPCEEIAHPACGSHFLTAPLGGGGGGARR